METRSRADFLHWSLEGAHVLFSSFSLNTFGDFVLGSLLAVAICLSERFITFALSKRWSPSFVGRSQWRQALWRAQLFWVVSLLRLAYMLIAMSFHAGLVLVSVTALATAQFFVELQEPRSQGRGHPDSMEEPLLPEQSHILTPMSPITRPRSKSKPDGIFIHPTHSNLARADAAALELGIAGSTERVHGNIYPHKEAAWETGQGRDAARALLGRTRRDSPRTPRKPFDLGDDSSSESSD